MQRRTWLALLCLFVASVTYGQYLPGLSYCLLFDSKLEKEAFQQVCDQNCQPLLFLLAYNPSMDSIQYNNLNTELTSYARKLAKKKERFDGDSNFLEYVFYSVHHRYLKTYETEESFVGIFDRGNYNCISGTALFAFILNELNYKPGIYETRYHIFLTINQDSLNVLFETTDPLKGFVTGKKEINSRIEYYMKNEKERYSKDLTLSAPFNSSSILEKVDMMELAGLHYYNLGLDLFNKENYYDAFRELKKASILYPRSRRIKDFLWLTQSRYDLQLSTSLTASKF